METSTKRGLMALTDARGVAERHFALVDAVLGASAEVQGDAEQLQVGSIADESTVAHPAPAVAVL